MENLVQVNTDVTQGTLDVINERKKHLEKYNSLEGDKKTYKPEELVGFALAILHGNVDLLPEGIDWTYVTTKLKVKSRKEILTIAASLLIAEIDRTYY